MPPTGPPHGWRAMVALTATVVAIGIGVPALSSLSGGPGPDPAELVRGYLAAVKTRDVAAALDIAGTHPTGGSARFLTAEAIGDGWDIAEVTETAGDGDTAHVSATLTADDGSTSTGEFTLTARPDGSWRLVNPFAEVRFTASPLSFLDVNGAIAALHAEPGPGTHLLLPGAYRFYGTAAGLFDAQRPPALLVPGAEPTVVPAETPVLTPGGAESARQAVEDHIDACANKADIRTGDCPFGTTGYVGERTPEGYLFDPVDVSWTVEDPPRMEFGVEGDAVAVIDSDPGTVTLKATGKADPDASAEHDIEVACEIQVERLRLVLTAEGAWRIEYDPAVEGSRAWRPGTAVDTCLN